MKTLATTLAAIALSLLLITSNGQACVMCPFCVPVQQTFGEEIDAADAVAIVELVHAPPADTSGDGKLERSKFKIVEIIKGEAHLMSDEPIELLYYGEGKLGDRFIMMAVDPPKLAWSTPTLLNATREEYIHTVLSLPAEGAERLNFFQDYLEDEDEMLARDAYDEFARAPYQDVIDLKDKMNHAQLIAWIKDVDIPASRRRLYLTMLGVCGDRTDADMLEGMLRGDDRKLKSGLDAMIACYLRLRGEEGLPFIEEMYLRKKDTEYADTYSAIMALRFHGEETDIIPQERIAQSMHVMLDRPELADLVIVDLARWEDWSVMDRLVQLFKDADDKSSWVRVPVVRYLMACPKDEAKKHLEALEKIDAGAVRRAKTFFPFEEEDAEETTSAVEEPAETEVALVSATGDESVELDAEQVAESSVTSTAPEAVETEQLAQSLVTRSVHRDVEVKRQIDFSNLIATAGVLIAITAVTTVYFAWQHFADTPAQS